MPRRGARQIPALRRAQLSAEVQRIPPPVRGEHACAVRVLRKIGAEKTAAQTERIAHATRVLRSPDAEKVPPGQDEPLTRFKRTSQSAQNNGQLPLFDKHYLPFHSKFATIEVHICTARLCICCKMTKIMELISMSNPIVTIEMENGGVIRARRGNKV